MRRYVIYPHRSIRALPLRPERILASITLALTLTVAIYAGRERLLFEHNRISTSLVEWAGIPVIGSSRVEIFPVIGSADVGVAEIFHYQSDPLRVTILVVASVLALLVVHRGVQLARNFIVFLGALLLLGAGVMVFAQSFEISSAEFAQMWLRLEMLVWLVLPWFSASLFLLPRNDTLWGIVWAVAAQTYGFVWSAVRLAFCVAVIHYSGLLFVPLLWFGLGLLADNVYLLVFFSLSTHQAVGKAWGRRVSWQF